MSEGTLLTRVLRGTRRLWISGDYRGRLPRDLGETVMSLDSSDRFHAKQGRSTARFRFDSPSGPLSVYLKKHFRLPWTARLAATLLPWGRFTPASIERHHLDQARALGIPVPDVVAGGESIGPWGSLQSFLMLAELTGCEALNETLPGLAANLPGPGFARLKHEIIEEMAVITARLHNHSLFHKDLYLCHFFLRVPPEPAGGNRLTLIDFHRMSRHRLTAPRWRWKDLAQLLYSTWDVAPISDRDRLRFWKRYVELTRLSHPRWHRAIVLAKARGYGNHNR